MAQSSRDSKAAAATSAAYSATKWVKIKDGVPAVGKLVLVKMSDGAVESARWNDASGDWSRAPFAKWGEPVAWTPVPLVGKHP